MRGSAIALLALMIAACDSGEVPPPGQEPLRPSTPLVAADQIELRADGLVAGSEAFYFAAGQSEVEGAVEKALGVAPERSSNEECGVGPIAMTRYGEDLTLNFQDGSLVGWTVAEADESLRVVGDVQVGTPRAELLEAKGFKAVESTLGEEFSLGDRIGGILEGDAVTLMYSGTQCFFR